MIWRYYFLPKKYKWLSLSWVQLIEDQHLTYIKICNMSINLVSHVSNSASCLLLGICSLLVASLIPLDMKGVIENRIIHISKWHKLSYAGADPGFQVRGARKCWGYFVWKITILRQKIIFFPIAEEGAKNVGVFRVKNHDYTPKNHIFSNFRWGARRVPLDPPLLCMI